MILQSSCINGNTHNIPTLCNQRLRICISKLQRIPPPSCKWGREIISNYVVLYEHHKSENTHRSKNQIASINRQVKAFFIRGMPSHRTQLPNCSRHHVFKSSHSIQGQVETPWPKAPNTMHVRSMLHNHSPSVDSIILHRATLYPITNIFWEFLYLSVSKSKKNQIANRISPQ